jgi:tetratricopeptide (TPR) repeat protein
MSAPPRTAGALALCRAGRFADAERELRALLASAPGDADVLQLLGIAASSQGRIEEGLAWFDRAKAARPGSFALMQNRAHALFQLGRLDEARAEATAMAAIDPSHPAVGDLLARITHEEGVAHHAAARFEQAVASYRNAIAHGLAMPQARANLGNALKMLGRDEEALAEFAEAARLAPGSAGALAAYGMALNDAGETARAIATLERAAQLDARSEVVQNGLGAAYFAAGRYDEAAECHRRALAMRPQWPLAENNLANALSALGQKQEALELFRAILARNPGEENALANMGAVLQELGDAAGAESAYREALARRPDFALALNNLGYLYREEGRADEAALLFERSLAIAPANPRAAYNLALARLTQGRFEEGWRLHEARFRTRPPATPRREIALPALAAGDIGRVSRVAVWREQGVGDQIVYSTALASLEARGQDFVLEMDARLVAAVKRAHPRWHVVAPQDSDAAFAACDRQAPMADVAGLLRPTRESFEAQPRAFLAADAGRAGAFRERLARPGRRLVGISWRSFQPRGRAYVGARKSAPLEAFAPLASRGDVRLVDLQYGDTAEERSRFAGELARLDELDLFTDLDGVLAAIEACDVVVTTSSVTAHLAGAAGKRTLLIFLRGLPPFHYWTRIAGHRSLWYPGVEIVSDESIDSWAKAIERVNELLGR